MAWEESRAFQLIGNAPPSQQELSRTGLNFPSCFPPPTLAKPLTGVDQFWLLGLLGLNGLRTFWQQLGTGSFLFRCFHFPGVWGMQRIGLRSWDGGESREKQGGVGEFADCWLPSHYRGNKQGWQRSPKTNLSTHCESWHLGTLCPPGFGLSLVGTSGE